MNRLLPLALISFLISSLSFSQKPDHELRAVWLTSVFSIDWPNNTLSPSAQKERLQNILNILQESHINAVLFQVRPSADALYQSAYEPWSQWITGTRGQDPAFDPLALIIEEAHKRDIKVHAWLNPYRFEMAAGQYSGLPGDYSKTHPELIFTLNKRTYFDPGNPGTTQLIKNIIKDLVNHYDIDGVVFDDYFYPPGMTLRTDQKTFDTYATLEFVQQWYPDLTRGNFRRASVNHMIREVNNAIKSIKPHLVFGVSPAGIYSTQASAAVNWGTTLPAGISGKDNFNVIYCDPLAWLHDGSIDYISPQLYWIIGGRQDFVTLNQWWGYQAKRYNRHHYPSLASYKLYSQKNMPFPDSDNGSFLLESLFAQFNNEEKNDKYNWPVTEIKNQVITNRNNPHNLAQGLIFFNTNTYINGIKNLARHLSNDLFSEKSVIPNIPWLTSLEPGAMQLTERADRIQLNEREQLLANAEWSPLDGFTTGTGVLAEDDRPHVLRVFPNPAYDMCMVDYPVALGERTIQWFSTNNKLLEEEVRKDITTSDIFDLTNLQPGLYSVQIQTENHEKFIFRVIKSIRPR